MPKISVIMPVYNGEKFLRQAIESILNQTFTDFEFLIFNDGSTDSSAEIIKSYSDKRIRFFNSKENEGLVFQLNKGIDEAIGEYIARMDADDVALPERFSKQIKFLEKNPSIALCGTWVDIIGEKGNIINVLETPILHDELVAIHFIANKMIHPSMIGKTFVFKEFKYKEEWFLVEDYYFQIEVAKKYKLANIPDVLLQYRHYGGNISTTRREKLEKVVRKIYKLKLKELDIEVDDKQLDFHLDCLRNQIKIKNHNKALKWFLKLWKTNKEKQVYIHDFFEEQLKIYAEKLFQFDVDFEKIENKNISTWVLFNKKIKNKTKLRFFGRWFLYSSLVGKMIRSF